jgi:hypothetical protein
MEEHETHKKMPGTTIHLSLRHSSKKLNPLDRGAGREERSSFGETRKGRCVVSGRNEGKGGPKGEEKAYPYVERGHRRDLDRQTHGSQAGEAVVALRLPKEKRGGR